MQLALLLSTTLFASGGDSVSQQYVAPTDTFFAKTTLVKGVRRERPLREIAQKTEVVTRQDIDATPATDLTDLLKKTSAIDVIQYPGVNSGVGMRGFRPQYASDLNQRTLFLVDGHLAGATNLASIGLFDVDHIELLKGPSSALFGPMAMGGVVNVVTARTATKPYAELDLGSFGKTEGSFGIGRRDNVTGIFWDVAGRAMNQSEDYRIGRNHLLRDGFGWDKNVPTTSTGAVKVDSGDGATRPYTKYQEAQGAVSLGWSQGPWYVRARTSIYDAPTVENPGDLAYGTSSQGVKNLERYNADLTARGQFGGNAVTLQGFRSREYSENWYTTKNYRYYDNTIDWMGAQARDNLSLGAFSLTSGIDWNTRETETENWSNSSTRSKPYNPDYAIHDFAGYTEASAKLWNGLLVPTAGVRYDVIGFETKETELLTSFHPETRWFNVFSPSAGLVSMLPWGFRAHASVGHGFVTPNAYQVAGYSVTTPNSKHLGQVAVTYGNADLDPENNWSVDGGLGVERPEIGFTADVTVFGNFVEDKIVSRTTSATGTELGFVDGDTVKSITRYVNADKATYEGLEISGSWDMGKPWGWRWGTRLFGNSTIYTTLDETSGDVTTDAMNVGTNWTVGIEETAPDGCAVRLSSRYVGRRYDTDWTDAAYPVIRYPAFLVTDVSFLVPVGKDTRLSLAVNNLTDENYYEKRGYNMPGRNWKIGLRHEF